MVHVVGSSEDENTGLDVVQTRFSNYLEKTETDVCEREEKAEVVVASYQKNYLLFAIHLVHQVVEEMVEALEGAQILPDKLPLVRTVVQKG